MEDRRCDWSVTKVSLEELLRCYKQPISEEQAWAICFQCCCKMKQLAQGLHPWSPAVVIKGPGSILIHSNGHVSFLLCSKSDVQKTQRSEDKLLECLGMVIYNALDWGIDSHMERELSKPLENLISLMLKLDVEATTPAISLQDVMKVFWICEEHVSLPSEASSHYRTISRALFADYMDFQQLTFTIQNSKESLKRMDVVALLENPSQKKANCWAALWHDVVRELQKGVKLRKATEQPQHNSPRKESARSPFEMLADDIRHKRHTLQKVKINSEQKIRSSEENIIPLKPPLKPVVERKLKDRFPQEPSQHELLMMEIKQPHQLRPSPTARNGSRPKDASVTLNIFNSPCDSGLSVQNASTGLHAHKAENWLLGSDLLGQEFQEGGWPLENAQRVTSERSSSQNCNSRGFSADCKFTPTGISVPSDLNTHSFLNPNHQQPSCQRRSMSIGSALKSKEHERENSTKWPLPTITDLIGTRYAMMASEMEIAFQRYGCSISSRAKVCFSCHKQMFFKWPYSCHLCSSVICCDCCIKMSMPFRQCVHLPLGFLKPLRVSKHEDPAVQEERTSQMLYEVEHWSCPRVPLVFEPCYAAQPLTCRKTTMVDWPSMDICTKCEQYLLHVTSCQQQCTPPRKRSWSWAALE
ncbi:protein spire homolog 1-like isoform X3 [Alligator sinensis]|uniref:Protein spire homolog 1-like isoform X3 n=1 Tax=Alligator sinensis TaxID=38654 RepID=A0A1U7RLC8_ALLSI|nr:protein spire homolog 1-like isoform X3 [Alligator sinensis]